MSETAESRAMDKVTADFDAACKRMGVAIEDNHGLFLLPDEAKAIAFVLGFLSNLTEQSLGIRPHGRSSEKLAAALEEERGDTRP